MALARPPRASTPAGLPTTTRTDLEGIRGKVFLGGHPLTGKERSGFEHADAALFQGTRYVLTPLTPPELRP